MKKTVYLLLMLFTIGVACNNESIEIYESPVGVEFAPDSTDLYYYSWDDTKQSLLIDSNLIHVILPTEMYDRILKNRKLRGEKSIGYENSITKSYFDNFIDTIYDSSVYEYIGSIETVIRKDELYSTDPYIYMGCVYKSGKLPSESISNYNCYSPIIYVSVNSADDVALVRQYAEKYGAILYGGAFNYLGELSYCLLFYTNEDGGMTARSVANILHETKRFSLVASDVCISWVNQW